jgi:UDP-N-acetylmuramyl pentapeptide phosphotransferase/UDP-N-acetylglucosamine-1-phosphate transferase
MSWLLTGLAAWYASRMGLLDQPGDRHSHAQPTPRGGGAGLVLALLLGSLVLAGDRIPDYWSQCAAPGVVVLALMGWWDDHRSLSVRLRLAVQLTVSIYLLWCAASRGWLGGAVPLLVGGLFVIWMTNLYNFMDGSNGMAGLQGIFAGCVMAWLFHLSGDSGSVLLAFLLAAACAGFLPWNLGRPRVFMGDVGSVALGFSIGALLLYGAASGAIDPPVAWLVMLLFLTDSTMTLLTRVMRRERWYNAHRQHLYQRLIVRGWPHGRVAMLYQAVNLALVLPAIGVAVRFPAVAWAVALVMTLMFACGWYLLTRKIGVFARAG